MFDKSMTAEALHPSLPRPLAQHGATRLAPGVGEPAPAKVATPAPPTLPSQAVALGVATAVLLLRATTAAAFPLIDPSNQGQVPAGTELATPDVQDLQHQLQLVNGLAAPAGGGWTIVPRLDLQTMLTDNVAQVHAPRQWDIAGFVAPGIGVAGDLPRLQITFDYAPTLALYAHDASLNSLTQQFDGTALVTVVPELAYVDIRALSGVHGLFGGIGGLGTIGASPSAVNATSATIPSLAGNSLGLNKNNEVQTDSLAISPYLLHRFGDYGTAKLGYSLDVTQSNLLTGFASPPFPTGGSNSQVLVTNEQIAHYSTDELFGNLRDSVDIDLQQSRTTFDEGFVTATTGLTPTSTTTTSTRNIISDRIDYVINRDITVFASGGHEHITYSGTAFRPIDDLIWSVGTTLTPNADSQLTLSYGHLDGYNSISANGYYAATARTVLTVSYDSSVGTQLQNLQNQLNLATINGTGGLVNGQTGGQLFSNINGFGVQNGVFRNDTFVLGSQTTLDRDIVSLNLYLSKQTQTGITTTPNNASTSTSKTANVQWTHELRPDLTLSSALSVNQQDQGTATTFNPGNSWSIAASSALQYQISDTLSASLRYAFFSRHAAVTTFDVYQNLLILGISKSF